MHQLFQGNDDGVARLLEEIINQILSAQATERVGALELRVPRVRSGQFSKSTVSALCAQLDILVPIPVA